MEMLQYGKMHILKIIFDLINTNQFRENLSDRRFSGKVYIIKDVDISLNQYLQQIKKF